ncbi:MAG: tetratricopeptide repeat protein [Parafilimonas sp.]
MKPKEIFFLNLLIIASACNSPDTGNTNKENSATNISQNPALKNLYQQVQQHPDSTGLRLQLAYTLNSLNEHKKALQQLDILIAKDSLNYGLWFTKGEIAENGMDTLLAMGSYSKAAKIYESPDALLALANLYAERKNDRAIILCSRVKALGLGREYDAHSAFIVGVYYARTGNRENAIKMFDECIANNYTYMEAYIEKGLVYFDEKKYVQALQVFEFAATVDNLYADAYYYQARCYEMLNKKDSAIEKFQQSLRLDNNLIEAKEGLKRLKAP